MSQPRLFRFRLASSALLAATLSLAACSSPSDPPPDQTTKAAATADSQGNPFYAPSPLPFHAPQFDKITNADYQPAIEEGMRRQLAEINRIANNPEPPTFKNTLVALEKSGQMLSRVMAVFSAVTGANTNPTLQKIQKIEAPKLAAHQDAIFLNPKLFARIETIYNERKQLGLDPESLRLVEYYYKKFVHAGARLSAADKAKLKKLNEEESTLSAAFQNKLLAAAKAGALVVDDKAKLAGLSDAAIAAAAQTAKARGLTGKWVIPLQNTTQQPALGSLNNRAIRHKLFEASWNRAEHGGANDTRNTIERIAEIRADKAKLLGFKNFAAWKLQNQMAKTPQTVMNFMHQLVPPSVARAKGEAADLQKLIDTLHAARNAPSFTLKPWDWEYYAAKLRKARYGLDEDQIKPYLELNSVLKNGVFYAAHLLYGLTFKERHDLPVWQSGVRVFEVFDHDGTPLGLFYCDYFKRDNKAGGAWMSGLVGGSKLLGNKPVVYNVANFTKPAPGQPALLTMNDVITMFHEFGHALHGLFADTEYPSLSGAATARDFVEFPSQFNEHWALYPEVFSHYAKNYKTGEPMPKALVEKIKQSRLFNQGYAMTETVEAALLDMAWHTLPASAPKQDADQFEVQALKANHVYLPQVPPRYRSSYFLHIWASGYAAGYYAYNWTMMLADDAFAWFQNHGGLTRENGDRFRRMVLSRGNTEDLAQMYKDWRGRAPTIEAMLKYRGLEPDGRTEPRTP